MKKLASLIREYGQWEDDEDGSPIPIISLPDPISGRSLIVYEDYESELYANSDGLNFMVQIDFKRPR